MTKPRDLTVHREWQPRKHVRRGIIVPHIRLSGRWLKEAGFSYGDAIVVQVDSARLTITLQEDNRQ